MNKISIKNLVQKCHQSAPAIAHLNTDVKNDLLKKMADHLVKNTPVILKENAKDLKMPLQPALRDRLLLNEKRILEMANGLREVALLPDPVGQKVSEWVRPNGLKVCRVRIPLGVIAVVYESRPNVTVDAAALSFKSGNSVVLRGGSEAFHSNQILGKILQSTLHEAHLPKAAITLIPTTDRRALLELLSLSGLVDVIIPRGGASLMSFMEEHSKIPVIKHDKGVCNLFVDESADIEQAILIIRNGKVQRPGVCNALENLFVHEKSAPTLLPRLSRVLQEDGVELRGDIKTRKILPHIKKAVEQDYYTEYLGLILSIKIVSSLDEAIQFIRKYGSLHTESIVTRNQEHADQFVRELDSSCVLVNASTRFNDGGQLGLGAEIGISTTKLHAFGPMGLEELTTTKFVVYGAGQVRQ